MFREIPLNVHLLELDAVTGDFGNVTGIDTITSDARRPLSRLMLRTVLESLDANPALMPLTVHRLGRRLRPGERPDSARACVGHDRGVLVVAQHPGGCGVDVEDADPRMLADVAYRFCAPGDDTWAGVRELWAEGERREIVAAWPHRRPADDHRRPARCGPPMTSRGAPPSRIATVVAAAAGIWPSSRPPTGRRGSWSGSWREGARMSAATLHEAFAAAAAKAPESPVNFPSAGEYLTLGELDSAATAAARGLVAAGVAPGDRVGVLSRNNADFLIGLFGVAAAGAAACPLPLPTSVRDLGGYSARLAAIMSAAEIRRVVVGARTDTTARRISGVLPDLEYLQAATLTGSADVPLPPVTPEDLAVVQFTSGSTSLPKGVRLTHANVLHGCAAICGGVAMTPGDRGANWLPLFHDMGLFGTLCGLLTPMPMTVWTPSAFVKDPAAWLRDFAARR